MNFVTSKMWGFVVKIYDFFQIQNCFELNNSHAGSLYVLVFVLHVFFYFAKKRSCQNAAEVPYRSTAKGKISHSYLFFHFQADIEKSWDERQGNCFICSHCIFWLVDKSRENPVTEIKRVIILWIQIWEFWSYARSKCLLKKDFWRLKQLRSFTHISKQNLYPYKSKFHFIFNSFIPY